MREKEIDVYKVMKTIDTTLVELKEEFDPALLTKEELIDFDKDLESLEQQALRIKLDMKRDHLLSLLESNKMNLSAKELKIVCNNIENINDNIQSFSSVKEYAA